MNNSIDLLIVEDADDQIKTIETSVDLFNRKNENISIIAHIKKNLEDGLKAISTNDFDAAIVDLKLSSQSQEIEGNKIINEIMKRQRFPIVVWSGFSEDLDEEIENQKSVFLKIYNKGVMVDVILNEIVELYNRLHNTPIMNVLGKTGLIDKKFNEIFWTHFTHSLSYWENLPPEDMEKTLLRYMSVHLSEYLTINQDGEFEMFEKYSPAEFYIIPPISNSLRTGDIVMHKDSKLHYLILTPSCDLVKRKENGKRKAENIIMASLSVRSECSASSDTMNNRVQNKVERYHYLPSYGIIAEMFIDFESIQSFKVNELENDQSLLADGPIKECKFIRKATITPAFLRNIIARFSHFLSRQGQPEFNDPKNCIN